MRQGASASEALDRVLAADDAPQTRQVGVVDREGRSVSHTGDACFGWAGHRTGPGYAAQGNMLVSGATVDALAETLTSTEGPLARRLLAALAAAQAAGGDRRGQQSAALLVAREGGGYGGADIAVDLRVDDHPTPIVELQRLFGLHELYFGSTPAGRWLELDGALGGEVRGSLERLGYATGDLAADLEAWAGVENLEERVDGAERIDPVVLGELRRLAAPDPGQDTAANREQEEPDG
jgi:uncharacterized Ntn-hydrolase superfamily protein